MDATPFRPANLYAAEESVEYSYAKSDAGDRSLVVGHAFGLLPNGTEQLEACCDSARNIQLHPSLHFILTNFEKIMRTIGSGILTDNVAK